MHVYMAHGCACARARVYATHSATHLQLLLVVARPRLVMHMQAVNRQATLRVRRPHGRRRV
jgi:hypothetical protein